MLIKKIIITELFDIKRAEFEIKDKHIYLFGRNGVGKTTFMDLLWYAINNKPNFFTENTSKKINNYGNPDVYSNTNIPNFAELTIIFDNDEKLNIGTKKAINIDYLKKYYSPRETEKLNLRDIPFWSSHEKQMNRYLMGLRDFHDAREKLTSEYEDIPDDLLNSFLKDSNKFQSFKKENENKGEKYSLIIDNLYHSISNMRSIIVSDTANKENEFRKKFLEKHDAIYLNINRMIPQTIQNTMENNMWKFPMKVNVTPAYSEVLSKYDEERKNLIELSSSIYSDFGKKLIEISGTLSKSIILNSQQEIILNHVLISMGFNSKETKENINLIKNNSGNTILNKIAEAITRLAEEGIEKFNSALGDIKTLINKMNTFFEESNKHLFLDEKDFIIYVHDENQDKKDKNLKDYVFSSGERQLITLLSNIIFSKKDNVLVLIDEPELSLSVEWQQTLYDTLISFENVQVIATTHSPFSVAEKDYKNVLKEFHEKK